MVKLINAIVLSCLLIATAAQAQPKNIQLEYDVKRNGKSFATVTESYVQEGNQYKVVSTTKGEGLYALLGERVLTSTGTVTAQGLVPSQFALKRGDNEKKSLSASFDWATKTLSMFRKGKTETAAMTTGTLDLASYPYQFMFVPPTGKQIKVSLTTGKKLSQYVFSMQGSDVPINVAGVANKTVHLVSAEEDGDKRKEVWLAASAHYIPVKYLIVDKRGDVFEQALTKISVK